MSWRMGYAHGCRSGGAAGRGYGIPEKDVDRYRVDDLYRKGWNEGFGQCLQEAKEETAQGVAAEKRIVPEPTPVKVRPVAAGSKPVPAATENIRPAAGGEVTAPSSPRRELLIERIRQLERELSDLKAQLRHLDE